MRAPLRGLFLVAALVAGATGAAAQSPSAVRVSAGNDAFNFWRPPWDRTDRDYTSGVRGSLDYEGPLSWRFLDRLRRGVCAPGAPGCATREFSLGQDIYTGDILRPYDPVVRPNAGWLFVEAAERDSTARVTQEVRFAFGVVGPPALAETMQRLFHSLGPEYNRPVDWHKQIPFEPGFVARLMRTTRLAEFEALSWRGALTSHVGGAVGTILTSATGGFGATAAVQLGGEAANKWWPSLEAHADVFGHGVVRDEFLDGTFFRSSDHVDKKSLYDEERLGVGLRWQKIAVRYRATRTGLQYNGQPGPAEWAVLEVELVLRPRN